MRGRYTVKHENKMAIIYIKFRRNSKNFKTKKKNQTNGRRFCLLLADYYSRPVDVDQVA